MVRLVAVPVSPADLDPPYWVAMGAAAIAVLACTRVLDMPAGQVTGAVASTALTHTLDVPLLRGLGTVMLWVAFGAWLALSGWMVVHVNRTVLRP